MPRGVSFFVGPSMTRLLTKTAFTAVDQALPEIQSFHCGEERWDKEVTEWIKSLSVTTASSRT